MSKPESQALQATGTEPKAKPVIGRPSLFSESLAAFICGEVAGGKTLSAICRTPGLPVPATVHRWRRENSSFSADYALARIDQAHSWGDECIAIADDSTMDTVTKTDPKGRTYEAVDHENIQRDRLRVDTRRFMMSKGAPLIYGEKVQHEHGGEIGHTHTVQLSDRERMRRLATFMLEDQAAGVTIEGEAVHMSIPETPATTGLQPVNHASMSPADIVQGVTMSPPLDDHEQ